MKSIYGFAFTMLLASFSSAQNNTRIRISLTTDSLVKSIDLINLSQTVLIQKPYSDSVLFSFNSPFPDQYYFRVKTDKQKYTTGFWIDSGEIKITAALVNDLKINAIVGSGFYDYFLSVHKDLMATNNQEKLNGLYHTYIKQNLANPFSLALIMQYFGRFLRGEIFGMKMGG